MKNIFTVFSLSLASLVAVNGYSQTSQNSAVHQTIEVGDAVTFSKSLPVEPGGKLTVKVDRGEVQIAGSDQNTVAIRVDREVKRASDSDAAQILKEERLTVTQTGNDISITAHDPPSLHRHSWWGWWRQPDLNAHYEISLPRKFDAQVTTCGGGVKVANLQGAVKVNTLGGALHFSDIDGKVDGGTMGGGIRADGCQDELRLHTMGGSIQIEKFTGPNIRATTQGGSVSADFAAAPKSDCELHTMGGSVTAKVPATAALTLDARTMGGSVRADLPVLVQGRVHASALRGTINGGGPLLKLETMGGNIELLKR